MDRAKRIIAAFLALAVVIDAPGPFALEAFAQTAAPRPEGIQPTLDVSPGFLGLPDEPSPLEPLPGSLPVGEASLSDLKPLSGAPSAASETLSQASLRPSSAREVPASLRSLRATREERESNLHPARQVLSSPSGARDWAAKSFSWLLGASAAVAAADALLDSAPLTRALAPAPPLVRALAPASRTAALYAAAVSAPPPAPSLPPPPPPSHPSGAVSEDFLGFRHLNGIRRSVRPLSDRPSAFEVQERIATRFGLKLGEVEEIGRQFNLPLEDAAAWLWVHDGLQKADYREFQRLDQSKYSVSFRDLANKDYAPGFKGVLQRAAGFHRPLIGLFVRFPYHLFDMFLFGYFRRAIGYQLYHSNEDFLGLADKDLAKKWLKTLVQDRAFRRGGALERLNAWAPYRSVRALLIAPIVVPLSQFLTRRGFMALAGAAGMGMLAGFAPFLPMAFHLAALPHFGPALQWLASGLPAHVAKLPWIGAALAPVATNAFGALIKEMVLGKLLNAAILSTILTLPGYVYQEWAKRWGHEPKYLPPAAKAWRAARLASLSVLAALVPAPWTFAKEWRKRRAEIGDDLPAWSRRGRLAWAFAASAGKAATQGFWTANLKSLVGLVTVGAEIEGILTYAGAIDNALFHGSHRPLEAVGEAVDRPDQWKDGEIERKNLLPVGGAITWGNVLLLKLESALHLSVSDAFFHLTNRLVNAAHPNAVSAAFVDNPTEMNVARGVFARATDGPPAAKASPAGAGGPPPDSEAGAQVKAGDLAAEIARVRAEEKSLQEEIRTTAERLRAARAEAPPIPDDLRKAYGKEMDLLAQQRDELYAMRKLSQSADLKKPVFDDATAQTIDELVKQYDTILSQPRTPDSGQSDSMSLKLARIAALTDRLADTKGLVRPDGPAPSTFADMASEKKLRDLVSDITKMRQEAFNDFRMRETAVSAMKNASKARAAALNDRRSGKEMMQFRENFARLSMVMELKYSLNVLQAAESAITGMNALLNAKLAKIQAQEQSNTQNATAAQANSAQVAQWTATAKAQVQTDLNEAASFGADALQAQTAVQNLNQFWTTMNNFISTINSQDSYGSPNAGAEYQRDLNLMLAPDPNNLKYYRTHGYPNSQGNSVTQLSLDGLNQQLALVQSNLQQAQAGLAQFNQLNTADNLAGLLILLVPGQPTGNFTQLAQSPQALLNYLQNQRANYISTNLTYYQGFVTSLQQGVDPNNTTMTTDDFGHPVPQSYVVYLKNMQAQQQTQHALLSQLLSQMDVLGAQCNALAPGSNLPMVSHLTGQQLITALTNYATALSNLPRITDPNLSFQQTMFSLQIGQLLPQAGRALILASEADQAVPILQNALTQILPIALAKLSATVSVFQALQTQNNSDIALVQQAIANHNSFNGILSEQQQIALMNTKKNLIQNQIIPMLQGVQLLLTQILIPYQVSSIATVDPNNTGTTLITLYKDDLLLYNQTVAALNTQFPWELASNGGKVGNVQDSLNQISVRQQFYQQNLQLINTNLLMVQDRLNPNFNGDGTYPANEMVYGQSMPYSLPKRAAMYYAMKVQHATNINQIDTTLNGILAQIDQKTNGKYGLLANYKMPTNITPGTIQKDDQNSVNEMNAIANNNRIQNLAALLTTIGTSQNLSGGISVGGSVGNVPSGNQGQLQLNNSQMIALLALQAGKLLAPTTAGLNLANETAQFLFDDAIVTSCEVFITQRLPMVLTFLQGGQKVIQNAINDLQINRQYVNSGGKSETAQHVYQREVAIYSSLQTFTAAAQSMFQNNVAQWDQEQINDISQVQTYYNAVNTLYNAGNQASQAEMTAIQQMQQQVQNEFQTLENQRQEVVSWLQQLNDPHQSALARVSQNIDDIQAKTRAVLNTNYQFHMMEDAYRAADADFRDKVQKLDEKQQDLERELLRTDMSKLTPDLRDKLRILAAGRGTWMLPGQSPNQQAMVIMKADFPTFLENLLTTLGGGAAGGSQGTTQDMSSLQTSLLADPTQITQLLPNSQVINFGDDVNGFYLVYTSDFAVPGGLTTSSQVTMGNIANVAGNNVSLTGYRMISPPNFVAGGASNAPWGDQGVSIDVETLQGTNWVNYLDVTMHKFIQDSPADATVGDEAQQLRMMVFDDFALLLFGDRLYIGATGFADAQMFDTNDNPYYYGGNIKTELKLTEVTRLTAQDSELFVNDPRKFLETVNLDFTGYDPQLNNPFVISANGANSTYGRTQVGPGFNVGKATGWTDPNPDKQGNPTNPLNTFDVQLYWANVRGTDDYNQNAIGTQVLTGVTISKDVTVTNKATVELGTAYNTYSDRVDINLPAGFSIFATGNYVTGSQGDPAGALGGLPAIGTSGTLLPTGGVAGLAPTGPEAIYQVGVSKKLGDNTVASISYGTPYLGLNNVLAIEMVSTFTLRQIWDAVIKDNKKKLEGGPAFEVYDKSMEELFKGEKGGSRDLEKVFREDVTRQLLTQNVGTLTKDLQELQKAGAFLDNSKVQAMIGWVSNPVSSDPTELAAGGGMQAGTMTSLTISKSQRALIDSKISEIYAESVKVQERMTELVKEWQQDILDIATARWEIHLAEYLVRNAPSEASRQGGQVRLEKAKAKLNQATLAYNMLTGRPPSADPPFDELKPAELDQLMVDINAMMTRPDRLTHVLKMLSPEEMAKTIPKQGFNLMDWMPIAEQLTVGFGFMLSDALGNQVLGLAGSIRLPIYDPESKALNHSYVLTNKAAIQEMKQIYEAYRLKANQERITATEQDERRGMIAAGQGAAAEYVGRAIAGYRNGLLPESQLWDAFERWRWYTLSTLEARGQSFLAANAAALDGSLGPDRDGSENIASAKSLEDLYRLASSRSRSTAQLELRSQAAKAAMSAADHRFSKIHLDLDLGWNLTATGAGWIPSIGITGFGIFPVLGFNLKSQELRELMVLEDKERGNYYDALKDKVSTEIQLELFETYATLKADHDAETLYRSVRIPELEARLKDAEARLAAGQAVQADVQAAKFALTQARAQATAIQAEKEQALAQFNFLLRRPLDAPVDASLSIEKAQSDLVRLLGGEDPVKARRAILAARLEVARAYEHQVLQDGKVQQMQLDPVSLAMSSLGRLIKALAEEPYSSPDKVASARQQVLEAERALESFDRQLPIQRAQAGQEVGLIEAKLKEAEGSTEGSQAERQLRIISLRRDLARSKAKLALLDEKSPEQKAPEAMPSNYGELEQRMLRAFEKAAPYESGAPAANDGPQVSVPMGDSYARYYDVYQTLGKVPVDKTYIDTWAEVRLASPDTSPGSLLELSKLVKQNAAAKYEAALQGAEIKAKAKLGGFAVEVRQWRAAKTENPELAKALRSKLEGEARQLAVLLGVPPDTPFEAFERLIPAEGPSSFDSIGREYLDEIYQLNIEALKLTVFPDGVPPQLSGPNDLVTQMKADILASRMSYHGYTPLAAFGFFRGEFVGGGFLQAPDPSDLEHNLSNIVGEAIRKDLQAKGELKRLALRLHQLMAAVEDGAKILEAEQKRLAAARKEYDGVLVRYENAKDPEERRRAQADEAAARAAVDQAFADLSGTLVKVKTDFGDLVTELEAIDKRSSKIAVPALDIAETLPGLEPTEELLNYWAERSLDPAFSAKSDALLKGLGLPAGRLDTLTQIESDYQVLSYQSGLVRGSDLKPAEKMNLLTIADVEGRRLALREQYRWVTFNWHILASQGDPRAAAVYQFLMADLKAQKAGSEADIQRHQAALAAMEKASFDGEPWPVQGAYDRLAALREQARSRWQMLFESYLAKPQTAAEFLLKDSRLDDYLKAQEAYDKEVVKTFQRPEVRSKPEFAEALDGVFDLKASVDRLTRTAPRKDVDGKETQGRVAKSRGEEAVEALLRIAQARLAGLRFDRAPVSEIQEASELVAQLRVTRDKWLGDPKAMLSGYALVELDPAGKPSWNGADWISDADLKTMKDQHRTVEIDGRLFVLPKDGVAASTIASVREAGGREVVAGADAHGRALEEARSQKDANDLLLKVQGQLNGSDFALTDGRDVKPMSFEEYQKAVSEGRLLFFESQPNPQSRQHARIHPLEAMWRSPAEWTAFYYPDDPKTKPMPHSDYPNQESLEPGRFWRLSVGEKGFAKLLAENKAAEAETNRAGWLALKLDTFGFAFNKAGDLEGIYLTEDEYKTAIKRSTMTLKERKEMDKKRDPDEPRISNPEPQKDWTFHRAQDLQWGLAADGTLARVQGPGLSVTLAAAPAVRWIQGHVLAVEMDDDGRLVNVYTDERQMGKAAKQWTLIDANHPLSDPQGARVAPGQKEVRPTLRLRNFQAGSAAHPTTIVLGAETLQKRLDRLDSALGAVKRWGFMPDNWLNIILETPRGIVKIPVELITGMDQNQDHYVGQMLANRTYGSERERPGFWMSLARLVDILDLIPDHVRRLHDPSQFPDKIQIDGRLGPTTFAFDRDPSDGDEAFTYGRESLKREVAAAHAELDGRPDVFGIWKGGLRSRVRSYFEGGAEIQYVERRRGVGRDWRGGSYYDSRDEVESGYQAMYDRLTSGSLSAGPDGSATVSEKPDNLEVDQLDARVKIRLGVREYEEGQRRMDGYAPTFERERKEAAQRDGQLGGEIEREGAALDASLSRSAAAARAESETFDKAYPKGWRIHGRDAQVSARARLAERLKVLEAKLAQDRAYLARLQARPTKLSAPAKAGPAKVQVKPSASPSSPPPPPAAPPAPAQHASLGRHPFVGWSWLLAAAATLGAIFQRKRKDDGD